MALLTPQAEDPDSTDAAAELGLALERALRRTDQVAQVGRSMSPDELLAAFGCLEIDRQCAQQVGRSMKATEVIRATVRSRRRGFEVDLWRLSTSSGASIQEMRWRVEGEESVGQRDDVLSPVSSALARWIIHDDMTRDAALLPLSPDRAPAQLDGRPVPSGQLAAVSPGRHEVAAIGRPSMMLDLAPGEIKVVDLPVSLGEVEVPKRGLTGRRLGAWLTLGLGVVAGLGASWAALEMGSTQDDFNQANDRTTLEELAARGNNLENTANGLMVLTVISLGTSTWLFLDD
ncbi:MAG: hypothetical protein ACE366_22405 [Bradymonadia bacterium]